MDEKTKSRAIAEVFTQLSEENKTRLEDIALGMRIQKDIEEQRRRDGNKNNRTENAEHKGSDAADRLRPAAGAGVL